MLLFLSLCRIAHGKLCQHSLGVTISRQRSGLSSLVRVNVQTRRLRKLDVQTLLKPPLSLDVTILDFWSAQPGRYSAIKAKSDHVISQLPLRLAPVAIRKMAQACKVRSCQDTQGQRVLLRFYAPVGCNRGFASLIPRQLHRVGSILSHATATKTVSRH